jgi:mono/diheme cytochrome c family protein
MSPRLWRLPAPAAALTIAFMTAVSPSSAQSPGDPERGRAVFSAKQCVRCHAPGGQQGIGPAVEELRRPQGAFELAGRLWNHAPAMFTTLRQEGVVWPEISDMEMADLMAYLRVDTTRDRAPDVSRGQALLVRKGCLKCHRFRGEGGSIGVELTQPHPGYDSAIIWGAAVWRHAPRMAEEAKRMGVLYPRFSGDEMENLVAFLRTSVRKP